MTVDKDKKEVCLYDKENKFEFSLQNSGEIVPKSATKVQENKQQQEF